MGEKTVIHAKWLSEQVSISSVEICQKCRISEELLLEMLEHGLLDSEAFDLKSVTFDYQTLEKIELVKRLMQDLGINLAGVALVLDLLEALDKAHDELRILRRHVGR